MLHIWLPTQQGQLYVWLDKQKKWQAHENWQSVSEHVADKKVCLYFPSSHVLQVDSNLSANELKQLGETGRQYLFDDMALSSVEQLLVRQMAGAGRQYLYATAKSDIEQWKKSASLAEFDIQYLLPDFLLLEAPADTAKVALYHDEETTLLRLSTANGMAVSYLPLVFEQLSLVDEVQIIQPVTESARLDSNMAGNDVPPANLRGDAEKQEGNQEKKQEKKQEHERQQHHQVPHSESLSATLAGLLDNLNIPHTTHSVSLKPVEQASRHPLNFMVKDSKQSFSPYIKTTLLVSALALTLQVLADGLSVRQYSQASEAIAQATSQQFKSWFPDTRLNSRTNLQAQLDPMLMTANSADAGTMELLQQLSPLIKQSSITARSLLLEGEEVKLQLVANNRGELDKLVKKISQQGMNVQLGAVNKLTASSAQNNGNAQKIVGEVVIATTQPVQNN